MNFLPVTISSLPAAPSKRCIMRRLGAVHLATGEDIENNFHNDWYTETLSHCHFEGVWRILPAAELHFQGELAARLMAGCPWGVLMAVTAGKEITQWINELFTSGNGAKGTFADAVASESVEDALTYMHKRISSVLYREGISVKKARISPGFGDFRLASQLDIMQFLECESRLGISMNEVFFMTPEKSATALTGAFEIVPTTNTGDAK